MNEIHPSGNAIRYIARQPIFDQQLNTRGYELLYRGSAEDVVATFRNADLAAQTTIDTSFLIGIEELSGGHRLFLNCTEDLLVREYATLLSPDKVILEVLETVRPSDPVINACQRLKQSGYKIALDDFIPGDPRACLLELSDFVKLDFQALSPQDCSEVIRICSPRIKTVAEKVETQSEYEQAKALGFDLFQGHFFCRPTLLSSKEVAPLRLNHIRLLQAACSPELDFRQIEEIIKCDAALCYRLLKYLNSAAFCLQSSISSIRHALALLGEREVRKWIAVSAVALAGESKPAELLITALVRARFCELLSTRARCRPYEGFLLGLFSMMEALVDVSLQNILSDVEIPPEPRAALLGKPVRLRQLYDLMVNYGSGWESCQDYCQSLGVTETDTARSYIEALQWVSQIDRFN